MYTQFREKFYPVSRGVQKVLDLQFSHFVINDRFLIADVPKGVTELSRRISC